MGDRESYLKTQQLADALGVSPSSVKRWVDRGMIPATKTVGKHRLIALSGALKFAKANNLPAERLLAMSSSPATGEIDIDVIEALLEALKSGDGRRASAIVSSAFRADRDAVALADGLVRPVMERIGQLWMVGDWDVYQEHQASQILAGSLMDLVRRSPGDDGSSRPLAVGAAPEGDVYTLPVLLGELVLRDGGWDVKNLGSNLPFRSLASAIRAYRPKLAFLSASNIADKARFLHEYSFFYEAASQTGTAIIVGGRALDPDLRSKLVYASFGDRMAHLAEFARRLRPSTDPAPGPGIDHPEPMNTST